SLNIYTVDNLEKLRSFASLVRCITALFPAEQAKNVFENACSPGGFNAAFENCNAIPEFIEYLRNLFVDSESTTDNVLLHRHRTLLKLAMEFLKNWPPNNNEQYPEVLALLKVELFSTVLSKNGQLEDPDEFKLLDECLANINDATYKIERLLVNRMH
ncbi:unnamed protein product, partial [Rotaria magnacalcarata]